MSPGRADQPAWPFGAERAADGHHRVIHVFSTRWSQLREGGEPLGWQDAQILRQRTLQGQGDAAHPARRSLAAAFVGFGHLERQYKRVVARLPAVLGTTRTVLVPHRHASGTRVLAGHAFIVMLPSGQALVCLSLRASGPLADLPEALIWALEQGPKLPLAVDGAQHPMSLRQCVHELVCDVAGLRSASGSRLAQSLDAELTLSSEMHTIIVVREGDHSLVGNEELVRRLLGRLRSSQSSVRDPAIRYPGELNRGERTLGAVRPGASVLAGLSESVCRNAFVSVLLQMGAASLLREARDETYAVLDRVSETLEEPHHHWSLKGTDPFEREQSRLATLDIAVSFQIESHLDIRRVISDAYLVDFHTCLADALSIPRSVEAIHGATGRLADAIKTAGTRSATRNIYAVSVATALVAALLALALDLLK